MSFILSICELLVVGLYCGSVHSPLSDSSLSLPSSLASKAGSVPFEVCPGFRVPVGKRSGAVLKALAFFFLGVRPFLDGVPICRSLSVVW
jgi:hypothetical protein